MFGFFNTDQYKIQYEHIQTNTDKYRPIRREWIGLYWISIEICPVSIQPAIQTNTYANLYWPIQTNTNQYVVNGLVCIDSVLRYILSVFSQRYRPIPILTDTDQYKPIRREWIGMYSIQTVHIASVLDCQSGPIREKSIGTYWSGRVCIDLDLIRICWSGNITDTDVDRCPLHRAARHQENPAVGGRDAESYSCRSSR
jgi:hypothetical protein